MKFNYLLAVGFVALASAPVARAETAPLLTFSDFSERSGALVSFASQSTDYAYQQTVAWSRATTFGAEVATAPAPGVDGLLEFVSNTTTTTAYRNYTFSQDFATASVAGWDEPSVTPRYLAVTGTIAARQDSGTNPYAFLSLRARGPFVAGGDPFLGGVPPVFPTLGLKIGDGAFVYNPLVSEPNGDWYSTWSVSSIALSYSAPTTFTALAYAPSGTVISDFEISITSSRYNEVLGPLESTTQVDRQVLATAVIPALPVTPVPEPETYGMMLLGLGVLGFIGRRKGRLEAAA